MPSVGFSTGCLDRTSLTLKQKIKFFRLIGADAIELCFGHLKELMNNALSPKTLEILKKFRSISIHAPWDIRYGRNPETDTAIKKLKELCDLFSVKGIVIHPRKIDNFKILEKSGLPFLIENSGRGEPTGAFPEYFGKLRLDFPFGFVLDAQHAYEHDPSMNLAKKLVEAMDDHLWEIHISGHAPPFKHVPVRLAKNREAIIKMLELKIPAPKILEGVLLENIKETAAKELALIKSYESQ